MAILGNTYLGLADAMRRKDPDSKIAVVIEMLAELNPILTDMSTMPCNDGTSNLTTVRTGLPGATWRILYQGVQPSKSTTAQVRDTVGMLETWSEVDAKLVDLDSDPAGLRLSEATAFLETLNQEMATTLFYGNQALESEKFTGLAPRFSDTTAASGSQIVNAGGTGSTNTSIWFLVWGARTVSALYPKGSSGGLQRDDKGMQTKTLADGSVYDVYREKFTWDVGLSVRDWRYISRVANVDVSTLTYNVSTGADLLADMTTAYYRLRQRRVNGGKPAIYCNTTIKEYLHMQAIRGNNANVALRLSEVQGEEVLSFLGIPIRESDALLNTEATVV